MGGSAEFVVGRSGGHKVMDAGGLRPGNWIAGMLCRGLLAESSAALYQCVSKGCIS